ncbi:o-succinylbenzoate synthase [Natronincola peptidivorans]|uniref:Dipeptide epimerase n=1 Tax=Natronincola peptidivorans TaxID=426128 RepID=A0A1I0FZW3_9FIRM|nr:dipeptide epimerase [Natronincola peptidivorans]SET63861.1 o-succinylbenzoate synthase [Natronincola peptidivorans]
MKITAIQLGHLSVPLKTPFKTALRTVDSIENIAVRIMTDTGHIGYGEAAPTAVITGDTLSSIGGAVKNYIAPQLIGLDIENLEAIMMKLDKVLVKNTSAKAAVDIALYDLFGQYYKAPLYKLLGGFRKEITTDITISVNMPEEMVRDSISAVARGYKTLKIKVGKDARMDLKRLKAIREAVGENIQLRIDANQGWKPKEAVSILRDIEDAGLAIEFVEQPVAAHDFEGLKYVTDHVTFPVMADESIFSPKDALKILQERAVDLINIKLMKTGGIHQALKIIAIAEAYGVECMMGCMLESKLSVTAAAHVAAAKNIVTKIDLDGPGLCSIDPFDGGAIFKGERILLQEIPGLGFTDVPESIFS